MAAVKLIMTFSSV